jgi:hypothetical protein
MGESTYIKNHSKQRLNMDFEFKIPSYLDCRLTDILIPERCWVTFLDLIYTLANKLSQLFAGAVGALTISSTLFRD